MSDVLLTRIADALEKIEKHLSKGGTVATAPTKPTPGANASPAAAGKAADKNAAPAAADKGAAAGNKGGAAAATGNKGGAAAGNKGGAAAPAPGNTKAPGGKYNAEQVRDMIRKVANDPGLGKQSARDVLEEEGGVTTVSELKPEAFDKVYEACQVLLNGEGNKGAAADDFDPTA